MSRPPAPVRPRYGRIAAAVTSFAVTLLAVLGGVGILPTSGTPAAADPAEHESGPVQTRTAGPRSVPVPAPTHGSPAPDAVDRLDRQALPARSGEGKRIVFSEARQRVWLVDARDRVQRTYLVSGSTLDNLDPGTYEVWSRSRWAVGVDDSGVMQHFVRFTRGPSGAAIGFHTIPTKLGTPLQSVADLGTPQSHGCIRQRTKDAIALWRFAPLGTTVVVTE